MAHTQAPEGFYTAAEARKLLKMTETRFHARVRSGAIPRVIPPTYRQGFYPKDKIDALAEELHKFYGQTAGE